MVENEEVWKQAWNKYFHEIRKTKTECWLKFLSEAEGKNIFRARNYTKGFNIGKIPIIQGAQTFEEKCNKFLTTLFPTQSPLNPNSES